MGDGMIRLVLSAVVALWVTGAARAASIDGVGLPDTYQVGGQTLVLNGIGIRTLTIFKVRAYVAGLYLPQKNRDPAAIMASPGPKVVLLQFLHSASKQQVERQYARARTTIAGMASVRRRIRRISSGWSRRRRGRSRAIRWFT